MSTLNFTPELARELQAAYDRAVMAEAKTFKFQGNDLLTDYAKYLLEYLKIVKGIL